MKRHDLHVHSSFSDGFFLPEELIEKAKEKSLEVLGFSDHFFNKMPRSRSISSNDRIKKYISTLQELKLKYEKDISIKIGAEIDFTRKFGFNPKKLPFNLLNNLDYVLFENMDYSRKEGRPLQELIRIRSKFNIPVGLAHYDMQDVWRKREEEIANILSENDIFIELNVSESGRKMRDGKYFFQLFSQGLIDELAERHVRFAVGSDSHNGFKLGKVEEGYNFINKYNLEVIDLVK